jgi:hypothetical protein
MLLSWLAFVASEDFVSRHLQPPFLLVVVLVCRVALGCQCCGGFAGGFFVVVVIWSLCHVGQWFGCDYLFFVVIVFFMYFTFSTNNTQTHS